MITISFPTVQNLSVNVNATYQGIAQPWGDKIDKAAFKVTFARDGHKFTTDYYCRRGTTCLDGQEAACALQCVLMDASSYDESQGVMDFAAEFGYSIDEPEDLRKVRKIYTACKKEAEAMDRLGLLQFGGEISEAIDSDDYQAEGDDLY